MNLHEQRRMAKEDWLYWSRQIGGEAWSREDKTEAKQILQNSQDVYKRLVEIENKLRNN